MTTRVMRWLGGAGAPALTLRAAADSAAKRRDLLRPWIAGQLLLSVVAPKSPGPLQVFLSGATIMHSKRQMARVLHGVGLASSGEVFWSIFAEISDADLDAEVGECAEIVRELRAWRDIGARDIVIAFADNLGFKTKEGYLQFCHQMIKRVSWDEIKRLGVDKKESYVRPSLEDVTGDVNFTLGMTEEGVACLASRRVFDWGAAILAERAIRDGHVLDDGGANDDDDALAKEEERAAKVALLRAGKPVLTDARGIFKVEGRAAGPVEVGATGNVMDDNDVRVLPPKMEDFASGPVPTHILNPKP